MLGKSGTVYLVTTRGQDINFPSHLKSTISKSLKPEYYFRYDCSVRKFHLYPFLSSISVCFLSSRGYCRSDSPPFSALACSSIIARFLFLHVLGLTPPFEGIQQYYIFAESHNRHFHFPGTTRLHSLRINHAGDKAVSGVTKCHRVSS